MELLAQIPLIGGTLAVVLPFLIVLSIVVFVHEFGHYIVGRWCGIQAQVFSIGFGKPLWKWTDRWGTQWQVAVLPLGGFVKFVGDMDPASAGRVADESLSKEEHEAAFHNAGLIARSLTVLAGPVANFLLSIAIFAGLIMWIGQPSRDPVIGTVSADAGEGVNFEPGDRVLSIAGKDVQSFADIINILALTNDEPQSAVVEREGETHEVSVRIRHPLPVIVAVNQGSPAEQAGLQVGDQFLSINGNPLHSYGELQLIVAATPHNAEIRIEADRAGERLEFSLVPELKERVHPATLEETVVPTIGIEGTPTTVFQPVFEALPIHRAIIGGVGQTWQIISGTMGYIHDMMFKGADTSQLGGPIRIAEVSGSAAEQGFSSLIWLIAVLSTSIGLINLFPIPILDGGHLMFYAVEFIRGRPVGETSMRVGTVIGLSLVLLLMVFATYNDLVRL